MIIDINQTYFTANMSLQTSQVGFSHHSKAFSSEMAKLAKRFRLDRRNRPTNRAEASGTDQVPNATINPPSGTQQVSQSFSFSVNPPAPDYGNSEARESVNETFPPVGTEGTDRFMITPVDDPRVKVVQITEALQFIDPVTGKPGLTPDVSEVTERLRAADMQRWFDTTPSREELESSRDEILNAVAFNPQQERIKSEKAAKEADNLRLAATKVNDRPESRKIATLPARGELRVRSIRPGDPHPVRVSESQARTLKADDAILVRATVQLDIPIGPGDQLHVRPSGSVPFNDNPAPVRPGPNPGMRGTQVSHRRSVSQASSTSSTLSSIASELFYGTGPISPLADPESDIGSTLAKPNNPTISVSPSPSSRMATDRPVVPNVMQRTSRNETQAMKDISKGEISVSTARNVPENRPSISSVLESDFLGNPLSSANPSPRTFWNLTGQPAKTADKSNYFPRPLSSQPSMASAPKSAAEHEELLKNNNDRKLGANVTPSFFSPGRPTSSYFTPKLAPRDNSTEPDLIDLDEGPHDHKFVDGPIGFPSAYPVRSPILRPACCPHNHHPVAKGSDAIGNHQERATSPPPTFNVSLLSFTGTSPLKKTLKTLTNNTATLKNMGPFLNPSQRPTERDVLAALIERNVTAAREIIGQYNATTTTTTSTTDASTSTAPTSTEAMNNSTPGVTKANVFPTDNGKGKAVQAIVSPAPTSVSETPTPASAPERPHEPKKHASPLFNIRKKSTLTGLRIQLDFFNKLLDTIQKKIDKALIYQPTPTLLERLRQLKHIHRGIVLSLSAAAILEDMEAVGYEGKLASDLKKFQDKLDLYDWEHESDDPMANPFGLPEEPAWRGPQFIDD
ncbi:hypothetical protein L873DRAFT_1792847 [Choiromyces venosus 120613-1]|uniref:Uncharacterized protein n=1 Tax=Choiromyces venosus 120613-1 TaxID=1336337 RepID=A0A3N4JD36_9PEZI|nr:hypothetical protein L873DRAFT_1792847 [Choiromyces venosus 120613-1]